MAGRGLEAFRKVSTIRCRHDRVEATSRSKKVSTATCAKAHRIVDLPTGRLTALLVATVTLYDVVRVRLDLYALDAGSRRGMELIAHWCLPCPLRKGPASMLLARAMDGQADDPMLVSFLLRHDAGNASGGEHRLASLALR